MPIVWVQTSSNRVADVVEAAERALAPDQPASQPANPLNDVTGGDTYLAENLAVMRETWAVDPWQVVECGRPNIGQLLTLGQRAVRRLTWWYTLPQTQQITAFQGAVVRTTDSVLEHLRQVRLQLQAIESVRAEQRLRAVEDQLRNARNEQQMLLRRILELEAQLHALTTGQAAQPAASEE